MTYTPIDFIKDAAKLALGDSHDAPASSTCQLCHGSGKIYDENGRPVICYECKGSGRSR